MARTRAVVAAALAMATLGYVQTAHAQGLQPPPAFGPNGPPPQGYPPGAYGPTPPPTYGTPYGSPTAGGAGSPYAPSPPSSINQQLDAARTADSGRGLEVLWGNVEGGASYASLGGGVSSGGPMVGIGLGVRLVQWTVGARVRLHPMSDFTLLQVAGEAGLHLPLGAWDPYAALRAGYASASAPSGKGGGSTGGFDMGLSLGTDYYLSPLVSLGADGSADLLFMAHTGVAVAASAHLGLHFDL